MKKYSFLEAANQVNEDAGSSLFNLLRKKWSTVPTDLNNRIEAQLLLKEDDAKIEKLWDHIHEKSTTSEAFDTRGWYQALYKDIFKGKKVLEIGSGFGIDGIYFASNGADWHFCDIVENNLKIIQKILNSKQIKNYRTTYLESLESLNVLSQEYDFIYCQGSMINTPFDFARYETFKILQKLKPGGRWVELCYPKERWLREGELPFSEWGEITDGEGTPWVEWYDLDRLKSRFNPIQIKPICSFNFMQDNFNWFDLQIEYVPAESDILDLIDCKSEKKDLDLSLIQITAHNNAKIQTIKSNDTHPFTKISTPSGQWDYANHFHIDFEKVFPLTNWSKYQKSIQIEISVQSGHIGIGLLNDNMIDFDTIEQVVDDRNNKKHVLLPIVKYSNKINLLIRQVSGSKVPSTCIIHGISLRIAPLATSQLDTGFPQESLINLSTLSPQSKSPSAKNIILPELLEVVDIDDLANELGVPNENKIQIDKDKSYLDWKMETDDAKILEYIYRTIKPVKHLEFGTWKGFGTKLCADNCDAEIWTINLPNGETDVDGNPVYSQSSDIGETIQTDSKSMIGHLYKKAGYSKRVHQILEDSVNWSTSNFPDEFFDTILIDGGHQSDIVKNDTQKALRLLKLGGIMMWHDFCPSVEAINQLEATQGVVKAVLENSHEWFPLFKRVFWVRPSFLLIGIK